MRAAVFREIAARLFESKRSGRQSRSPTPWLRYGVEKKWRPPILQAIGRKATAVPVLEMNFRGGKRMME
jgi:hypothetical protein